MNLNINGLKVFKKNYVNNMHIDWDLKKDLIISDKTSFVKSFERWYDIKPHLNDLNVRLSLAHGFSENTNENIRELIKGMHPHVLNYCGVEEISQLESIGDVEYLIKHDPLNEKHYRHEYPEIHNEVLEELTEDGKVFEEFNEEELDAYFEIFDDLKHQKYGFPTWLANDSWFNYVVAHRCQNMSYYEAEFGKILEPKLDWWIVHTDLPHGFAIGVNEDGYVEYIYDMSWYSFEKRQDIEAYLKRNELL